MEMSDRFDDDEVADFVRGLDQEVSENVAEWNAFGRAYRSQFWQGPNPWSKLPGHGQDDDPLPVKIEVNQVWPFVQAHVSNLYYRAPRTEIEYPAVTEVQAGRPKEDLTAASRMKAFDDEWIRRSDIQEQSTYALMLALFHGVSAYKLGLKPGARGVMDRVWVDVIPRWELLWDDRAHSYEQQAYRGHIRWERIDQARKILGDALEGVEGESLPDVVGNEGTRSVTERFRAKKYVRILEFYDLLANEQRFYLVNGAGPGCSVKPIGDAKPIPWDLANGRPGVPIIPVILSNEPEFPLRGIPAVRRIYGLNSETNLLFTIVANGLRRDAARLTAVSDDLPPAFAQAIREARDGTCIPISGPLDGKWKNIEFQGFSSTLDKYKAMLMEGRQDAQGFSDLMQGRQGKYLSATEADILAGSGETAAIEIGMRMSESMARTMELVNVIIGESLKSGGSVHVQTVQGRQQLTKDEMLLPWTIGIVDSGTTPVREGKKKQDFLAIQPQMIELVKIASSPDPTPGIVAPQAPGVPPAPTIAPEVKLAAQGQIDYMVALWGLPETMSWRSLSQASANSQPSPPDPAKIARVQELMNRTIPEGPPLALPKAA